MRSIIFPLMFLVAACQQRPAAESSVDEAADEAANAAAETTAGISTPVGEPPAESPDESNVTWAFEAAAPSVVIEVAGRSYVQRADAPSYAHEHLERSTVPAEWQNDSPSAIGALLPYAGPPLTPPALTVLTPEGTCEPELGAATWVNRGQCNGSASLAHPISGCEGALAPFAWAAGSVPAGSTWVPAPEGEAEPWDIQNDESSPVADWAAAWRERLASQPVLASLPVAARVQTFRLNAGDESLDVHYGAAQSSPLPSDECDGVDAAFERAFLRPGGAEVAVRGAVLGVVATGGQIAAIITGNTNYRQLYSRDDAGALTKSFDVMHREDTSECVEPLFPLLYDERCGL